MYELWVALCGRQTPPSHQLPGKWFSHLSWLRT